MRAAVFFFVMLIALRLVGALLHIPACMAGLGLLLVGTLFDLRSGAVLLVTGLVSLGAGQLAFRLGRDAEQRALFPLTAGVAVAWLLVPAFGAIPYWMSGYVMPEAVAGLGTGVAGYFEAMSGFTSCGLTVCSDTSELAPMLQFWRSLSQWTGGLGMVIFVMMIVDPDEQGEGIYNAEGRSKVFADSVSDTIRFMGLCYLGLTAFAVATFLATGMPAWEAVNHGLTAVSTGGLTMNGEGIGAYGMPAQAASMLSFLLGACSFRLFYVLLRQRSLGAMAKNSELRFFVALVLGGAACIPLLGSGNTQPDSTVFDSVFIWLSALSTCGFSTEDLGNWDRGGLLFLIFGMLVGGMAGSTAGGIKVRRLAWLVKSFAARINATIGHPQECYIWDGEEVSEEKGNTLIRSAAVLVSLWGVTLFVATSAMIGITGTEFDYLDIAFEVTSALSGVGLSTGLISSETEPGVQLLFTGLMWLGRLEILTGLALFYGPLRLIAKARA